MLRMFFHQGQNIALTLGLPLLLFLGLRADYDNKPGFVRDAKLAFALLAVILLVLTGGLLSELALYWPLPLALVFLALLASALFKKVGREAEKPAAPPAGSGKPQA